MKGVQPPVSAVTTKSIPGAQHQPPQFASKLCCYP